VLGQCQPWLSIQLGVEYIVRHSRDDDPNEDIPNEDIGSSTPSQRLSMPAVVSMLV